MHFLKYYLHIDVMLLCTIWFVSAFPLCVSTGGRRVSLPACLCPHPGHKCCFLSTLSSGGKGGLPIGWPLQCGGTGTTLLLLHALAGLFCAPAAAWCHPALGWVSQRATRPGDQFCSGYQSIYSIPLLSYLLQVLEIWPWDRPLSIALSAHILTYIFVDKYTMILSWCLNIWK